jgi:hypothetical protein
MFQGEGGWDFCSLLAGRLRLAAPARVWLVGYDVVLRKPRAWWAAAAVLTAWPLGWHPRPGESVRACSALLALLFSALLRLRLDKDEGLVDVDGRDRAGQVRIRLAELLRIGTGLPQLQKKKWLRLGGKKTRSCLLVDPLMA